MIDIHCHILPQVDDGSKSWDMSLEMCRMATDDGIEHIVATPHANERFQYNRQHLASNLEYLRVLAGRTPQLTLGCDFHLSYDNLREVLVSPERFTIEGTLRSALNNKGVRRDCWVGSLLPSDLGLPSTAPYLPAPTSPSRV